MPHNLTKIHQHLSKKHWPHGACTSAKHSPPLGNPPTKSIRQTSVPSSITSWQRPNIPSPIHGKLRSALRMHSKQQKSEVLYIFRRVPIVGVQNDPEKMENLFFITYLRLVSGVGNSRFFLLSTEKMVFSRYIMSTILWRVRCLFVTNFLSSKRMIFCGWTKLAVSNFQHQSGDTSAISKPLPEKKSLLKRKGWS